jgi:hypothetical protein
MAVSAKRFVLLLVAAAAFGSGGCLVEEDGSGSTDEPASSAKVDTDAGAKSNGSAPTGTMSVETTEFLRMVAGGGYTKGVGFMEVTSKAYASALGVGSIRVWVTTTGADSYLRIDPGAQGSKQWLPRGSVIVRAVVDDAGAPTKLTLMAKGSVGSNPELGDYWFAVTTPQGVPVTSDAGVRAGALSDCFTCHRERATDDFLFGVPSANRVPHP